MFRKSTPIALAVCAALLSGCASDEQVVEVTEGFFGAVAVDEPRAAVEAQDLLVEGGNAVDAAVSTFFTLAVTLPSSAGLGAGGSCVVFDPEGERFEGLDFPPQPVADDGEGIAVPLGPRGMFALHARYGSLPFSQLIGRAEQLARFGDIVSRRLAEDIARDGAILRAVAGGRSGVLAPGEVPLEAGAPLVQLDLATTLSRLRIAGVGDLYSGQLAQRFVEGVRVLGYRADPARLRQAVPVWSEATGVRYDNHLWAVAASRTEDRTLLAKSLSLALNEAEWSAAPRAEDALMVAEIAVRSANAVAAGNADVSEDEAERLFEDFRPEDRRTAATPAAAALFGGAARSGATSFAITDKRGLSVGCALTMNTPFGTGQILRDMGMLAVPARTMDDAPLAAAVVAGNRNTWQVHLTAMAVGGREVVSTLSPVIARTYIGGQDLAGAIAAPRSHFDLQADALLVEPALSQDAAALASMAGYPIEISDRPIGAVRLFRCNGGYPGGSDDCGAGDDPRGRGLMLFEAFE